MTKITKELKICYTELFRIAAEDEKCGILTGQDLRAFPMELREALLTMKKASPGQILKDFIQFLTKEPPVYNKELNRTGYEQETAEKALEIANQILRDLENKQHQEA